MLQTMGGNPKNFNKLDLKRLPSPCFVIDKIALQNNLEILFELKKETKIKILKIKMLRLAYSKHSL